MNNKPKDDTFLGVSWSVFMESVGEHLSHRNYSNSNGYSNRKLQVNSTIAMGTALSVKDQDYLANWARDLYDANYRLWVIKRLKIVGKEAFISYVNAARKYDGVARQKVFVSLLKG